LRKPRRILLKDDIGVWEALIGGDYVYFEAPPDTAIAQLEKLAVDAYLRYVQEDT
jgi:hypothetical protein